MHPAKKFTLVLGGVLFLGLAAAYGVLTYGTYSEGIRAGTVLKVSKRGYLLKTYEGQLSVALVGGTPESVPMAQIWDFSVESSSPEVVRELEDAALSGHRVRLSYRERYLALPWNGDTKYFVTRVERD